MKPIKDQPGYFCDSNGKVYSNLRCGNTRVKHSGNVREVIPWTKSNGYQCVSFSSGGKRLNKYVHRVVLETWLGLNDGLDCNHKNGNKADNRLENLEWATRSQNMLHSVRVLGHKNGRGEQAYYHKATEELVRKIRELRKSGLTYGRIAQMVQLNESWVYRIAVGKAWSHVQ